MATALIAAFLIAHGLVHLPVWLAPAGGAAGRPAPFDPRRSWVFAAARLPQPRAVRRAGAGLAAAAAVLYVFSAAAVAAHSAALADLAVSAALVGLTLKVLWFHPWLSMGVVLDVVVLVAIGAS
ncbi:hypothetical protein H9Y04_25625 [Streptomyces sp. TRM66268-LWL]|uniref:Uncharacterized protein n=1 Tax=Streptomyces polyasparticus TaxID=2767826 RepID=A0ABR7SKC5_9ACTN|nr:hypothetical protein [Streptomyces polyasparticus]MBC9715925.1 hypothetical protein [Streptomyces polyasparticus]